VSRTYPKRPAHFDPRFQQALIDRAAANTIGPAGCWLLTVIVNMEDRKRYEGPAAFWSHQLTTLLGVSEDSLGRIRKRCVESGWLHYEPGAKAKAARYWVTVPGEATPPQVAEESMGPTRKMRPQVAEESAGESRENPRDILTYPIPDPKAPLPPFRGSVWRRREVRRPNAERGEGGTVPRSTRSSCGSTPRTRGRRTGQRPPVPSRS
jgi:hypothetical protein